MQTTPQKDKIDVLVIVSADVVGDAVREVFGRDWIAMEPIPQIDLSWYKIKLTSKNGRRFSVGLVRSDMRTEDAGTIATTMLEYLQPSYLAMCGVCAGRPKDTELGDVIISDKVVRYDVKSKKRRFLFFVDEYNTSTYHIAASWWQLARNLKTEGIKTHIEPIATGKNLKRDPKVWKIIQKYEQKCIGLDMEASVIDQIADIMEKRWVVIKGVTDEYHKLAIGNAAKVLKIFLEHAADDLSNNDEFPGVWIPPVDVGVPTLDMKNAAPSTLLKASNEYAPFMDEIRRQELEALQSLCEPDNISQIIIQLFTGPSGVGKTRLMIEWIRRLRDADLDWLGCFLMQNVDPNNQDFRKVFAKSNHIFFVIDYAECRTNLCAILKTLIEAVNENQDRMARVALLARHSGDWWNRLSSNNTEISSYLKDLVVELRDVPIHNGVRKRIFDSALEAFAEIMENKSSEETIAKSYAMLEDPIFESVLYIHMAAYATVTAQDFTVKNLLRNVVDFEKHFWPLRFDRIMKEDHLKEKFIRDASRVISALTLFGGVSAYKKLMNIINMSQGPADYQFPEFLRNFYPPAYSDKSKIVGCLAPDLFGEYLILDTLNYLREEEYPFNDAKFLANTFDLTNDPDELQQAFTILSRIAEHDACNTDSGKAMISEWLSNISNESHIETRSISAVRT